jgi:shikimate kinase
VIVVLVGMPGCGKSTVGKQLARQLGWPFFDSDTEIEARLGHSIREHFERFGEASFRDIESREVARLCGLPQAVLATGGGAVLRPENRAALRSGGNQVIYLRAQVDDLARRLKHDVARPLLQTADPLERLRQLFKERDPLYREVAHYVVDTGRTSVHALAQLLVMQLELR